MPTAAEDLNLKLRLETLLRPGLRRYNRELVRQFATQFADDGTMINTAQLNPELTDVLSTHYQRVTDEFSDRVRPELPVAVEATAREISLIESSLVAWIILQTAEQAAMINAATQTDILTAVEQAEDDPSVRELLGRERRRTTAAISANNLTRALAGRESGVLMTETQIPAETAKATEVEVLTGNPPSVAGGSHRPSPVLKEWVSVGDSRVREDHISADGQRVPLNDPFIVGGDALRWPGDASLGASIGNIINCRCGSVTRTSDIINVRSETAPDLDVQL